MPDSLPRLFTADMLAERWGCSSPTIRTLCRDGKLAHFKVGKEYRIPVHVVLGVEACGEKMSESNFTEEPIMPSGETGEKPVAGRFVPKIVGLLSTR